MGKHHADSSEDDSDGAPSGDEDAGAQDDPFFTHDKDPFSDPFFQVPGLVNTPCIASSPSMESRSGVHHRAGYPSTKERAADQCD